MLHCRGGDIKELEGAEASELDGRMRDFHALLTALDRYPRPVVGAVNGHCVGGGHGTGAVYRWRACCRSCQIRISGDQSRAAAGG
ncbi:enoyl-CoA hydratase-related protein [Gordonia humi]|uniref:enoyl-CoA hydratase-related protein n=1 Tax=Gordonia humi TaxID=686429 RepID=UPI0036226260